MNINRLNWEDIRLFLSVAENGSFSAAAREMGIGQPTLSRRIAQFESQLDKQLFNRLRHGCELTAFGQQLMPTAEKMAQWSLDMISLIDEPNEISGRIRITAPPVISFALLPMFAVELTKIFPNVQLEVSCSMETLSLARGEADIALRTAIPDDDNLVVLGSFYGSQSVYVTSEIAKSLPENLNLSDVNWICWPDRYDNMRVNKVLKERIPNFQPTFTSDDFNVQLSACCAGVGAMVLPTGLENSPFLKGLQSIPMDIGADQRGELHIIVHARQQYLPRLLNVTEQLKNHFSQFWSQNKKSINRNRNVE